MFTGSDVLDPSGTSQAALRACSSTIKQFPAGLIDLVVFHSLSRRFEWTDLPPVVKKLAEMRTYGIAKTGDAYDTYGVSKDNGVIAIVRPDGYIGALVPLSIAEGVEDYFHGCLTRVTY